MCGMYVKVCVWVCIICEGAGVFVCRVCVWVRVCLRALYGIPSCVCVCKICDCM